VGVEPPRGVEPRTYALRESRADAPGRLAAPTAHPSSRRAPTELGEQASSCQLSCQKCFGGQQPSYASKMRRSLDAAR